MAYSVVPTAVTGDLWTAANHNSYIRDNFAAGVPDIFTAAGDLVYATAVNAAAALAIGTTGQILRVNDDATAPEWTNDFWCCSIQLSTDQTINADSATNIIFDTETFDVGSFWSDTDADGFYPPYAGVYQFSGFVKFSSTSTTANVQLAISNISEFVRLQAVDETIADRITIIPFCYTKICSTGANALTVEHDDTGKTWKVTADVQVLYIGAST